MPGSTASKATGSARSRFGIALLATLLVAASCGGEVTPPPGPTASPSAAPSATEAPLQPLTVTPEFAYVGDRVTASVQGLPPGKTVDFLWGTFEGSYETKLELGSIEFIGPTFAAKRLPLGQATTDAQGGASLAFNIPEDYATRSVTIYAAIDGQDVAQGGVYAERVVSVSPLQGPVGTPITIEVKGLDASAFRSTVGVSWDNQYMGFMSSTTTSGSAKAVIRAAGPVGEHMIDIRTASAAVPYLNSHQTPRKYPIPSFRFTFTVTEDDGPPPNTVEWPDQDRVAKVPTLPISAEVGPAGTTAVFTNPSGPILSRPNLVARALTPGSSVDLVWMTITGSDVTGWEGENQPMGTVTADSDGLVNVPITIPDGLGGLHTMMLIQGDKVLAQVPYFVERSLIVPPPRQVKAGEAFKLEIKGVGWTELDNGVAVLYDNRYVGYACGFGSGGSVEVELSAMGGPGTHLIELYPMIYNRGFSKKHQWNYEMPQLTFAQDHPGLVLGYKLPVFRMAVEVVS